MLTKIPRVPTDIEKEELAIYNAQRKYTNPSQEEREQERGFVEDAFITVFDNYISDSPGYAGKVVVVVWSGGPSLTETYTWDRIYVNGEVNIPIRDTRSSEEGNYTTKIHRERIEVFGEE